jgi:hypothetical protein
MLPPTIPADNRSRMAWLVTIALDLTRKVPLGMLLAQTLSICATGNSASAVQTHPRIVNIYNFIRNSDFRLADSEDVLFECTRRQIALLKSFDLPATWALQYDALMNPRYQKLL